MAGVITKWEISGKTFRLNRFMVMHLGPVYTIPDYFSYRINSHSDGNIRGCLHYTA